MGINKFRYVIAFIAITFLTQCSKVELTPFQQDWKIYKQYFLNSGRIIDTANQNISHSESQGYGMLFAVYADDSDQFNKIWGWTKNTLQRPDHLFSWKYVTSENGQCEKTCIPDPNNATDGDILIAWALYLAAEKWDNQNYYKQANTISEAIKSKLIRKKFGYYLLLPGEFGFESPDNRIQINLSYWVFPALQKFSEVSGDNLWENVYHSGIDLIQKMRLGKWNLPPDWAIISKDGIDLKGTVSQLYGYNACRIPIYLMLANQKEQSLISPFFTFWAQSRVPATVNLDNNSVSEYELSSGMKAISIATHTLVKNQPDPVLPKITKQTDYYSASLILLSQLALLKD